MRKLLFTFLLPALVVAACGAENGGQAEPTASQPGTTGPQDAPEDNNGDADDGSSDQSTTTLTENSNPGDSSDAPIPEGDGPLPPNSIRIGNEIFARMAGASLSDCFVQEGTPPFSINGALNDDDRFRFGVYYVEDGVYEASIENDEIFWVAAPIREETELEVEWDVDTQTISGTGLFNDAFLGKWAYGSFQFTCSDG